MSVVVGTAGHIDHGKTSLLRALTGIDADRLPEERRRGMTIDVGYAHLALPDGDVLDFVDVPGHDRLVGNMLVGAGEIDAALLVVAADDGPRAQTLEHLELLDALGIEDGIAVVTKVDLLAPDDPRRTTLVGEIADLLARTTLVGSPVVVASAETGEGLDAVRAALAGIRDRVRARRGAAAARPGWERPGPGRLPVDRSFVVRGRGRVVTGTMRGETLANGQALRVLPGGGIVRIREIQVRGQAVERVTDGGRVALNLAGEAADRARRGDVLVPATDGGPAATDRILVALRPAADLGATRDVRRSARWPDGATGRLHLGTASVDATVRRSRGDVEGEDGSLVTRLHLAVPIAVAAGDRFALRRSSPAATAGGGIVLDELPPRGPSRRHAEPAVAAALRDATTAGDAAGRARALLELHGVLPRARLGPEGSAGGSAEGSVGVSAAGGASLPAGVGGVVAGPIVLSPGTAEALDAAAVAAVADLQASRPDAGGLALADLRRTVARALRRRATVDPADAAHASAALVDRLVAEGRLARDGDVVRDPSRGAGPPPALVAAMNRLEAALTGPTPPPFGEAVRAAACPPDGVRALEQSGRIVRLEPDLAFATTTFRELAARALAMAREGPLTPAAYRDATGSSRRYALAILEDLDRRQVLLRGPDGHVPGPRAGSSP